METITKTRSPDVKQKAFPFPNGEAKKLETDEVVYRECLKNHAASLGGHALDGCGEFMPSLTATPSEPTSLKCAACGCHRNFHRRIALRHRPPAAADDCLEGEGERDDGLNDDDDADDSPHMLLALSTGGGGGGKSFAIPPPVVSATPLRKRFRSKFSPEQKEKMLELSERLGWRLQKRDEELVAKCCDEIGVGKGVFKVWMHNNKYHLFGSRRGETVSGVSPPAAAAGGGGGLVGGGAGACKVDENGNGMNGAC